MSRDPSVFSRWSERKRAVAAEAELDEGRARVDVGEGDIKNAPQDIDLTDEEVLERLGLPDPESMAQGDDFAAFLKDGVPEALKKRALRRLWRSNPVLANLDGLIDHGEDYTDAAMVPDTMNTLYQVGQGMLRKVVEAPAAEGETAVADVAQSAEGLDGVPILVAAPVATPVATPVPAPAAVMAAEDAVSDPPDDMAGTNIKNDAEQSETVEETVIAPRRMAFRCD